MKDDQQHSEKFEKKYKNQPLEDSDVKKIRYFDLQGRGFSLLSYWLSNIQYLFIF